MNYHQGSRSSFKITWISIFRGIEFPKKLTLGTKLFINVQKKSVEFKFSPFSGFSVGFWRRKSCGVGAVVFLGSLLLHGGGKRHPNTFTVNPYTIQTLFQLSLTLGPTPQRIREIQKSQQMRILLSLLLNFISQVTILKFKSKLIFLFHIQRSKVEFKTLSSPTIISVPLGFSHFKPLKRNMRKTVKSRGSFFVKKSRS